MYRSLTVLIFLSLVAYGLHLLINQSASSAPAADDPSPALTTPEIRDVTELDDIFLKLQSPLTTYGSAQRAALSQCQGIEAIVEVPTDAPADLGIGAYVKDQDGSWFQQAHPHILTPGKHQLFFPLHDNSLWQAEPAGIEWNDYRLGQSQQYGLYFWSQENSRVAINVIHLREVLFKNSYKPSAYQCAQLQLLSLQNYDSEKNLCTADTGERWEIHCRPEQLPQNPFNDKELKIDALISDRDGVQRSYAGFYYQPIDLGDAGDSEHSTIQEPGYFVIRYRPQQAGHYQIQLQVQSNETSFLVPLPPLQVNGEAFTDYVKIDKQDGRYFSIDDSLFWPNGLNIRSVNDSRGHEHTRCVPTPTRGSLAYQNYLERLHLAGANCAEIWMCSWNLALEWRRGWPGYFGAGYYHEGNAERLDRILDKAYEKNLRIILVLNNHGQASSRVDSEWNHHPYNRRNGGFLSRSYEIFTSDEARQAQEQLRRYIVARYADHPALMCWKLWTEQDLTDVGMTTRNPYQGRGNNILRDWHRNACRHLKSIDHYQHPVVTHWSSDYTIVDRSVAAVDELDAIFIDAYHHRVPGHQLIADFLLRSMEDPNRGLQHFKKPILCTEFGGTPMACAEAQLLAEHLCGPWAGLMSGHAGSPLIWWFEWVDQQNLWHPYRAIGNFMDSEKNLHGMTAVPLQAPRQQQLWTRALVTRGRMLGYVLDSRWGYNGQAAPLIENCQLKLGDNVKAGKMLVEWWDASLGQQITTPQNIDHPGGVLKITIPPFRRHLAFKLYRP